MYKKAISILLVLCLILSLSACGGTNTPAGEGDQGEGPMMKKIKETGKLVVGTSADYPPYEWIGDDNGEKKVMGFDIALAQAVADSLGVKLEIQDMDFNGILTALSLGEIDLALAGLVANDDRREQVDFSDEYYAGGQSMLIRKSDEGKFKTLGDFNGAKIAAQQGTTQEELAKTVEGANVDAQINLNNMVLELKGNAIDGIVIASPPGSLFAKNNPDLLLIDVGFPKEEGMAVGIAKGNEDLVEAVNKVIKEWKESGKVEEQITHFTELSGKQTEEN